MGTDRDTDSDVGVVVLHNAAGELCVMADIARAAPEALWIGPDSGMLALGWSGGRYTRCRDPVSRATIAQLCAAGVAIVGIGAEVGTARFYEVPVHLGLPETQGSQHA